MTATTSLPAAGRLSGTLALVVAAACLPAGVGLTGCGEQQQPAPASWSPAETVPIIRVRLGGQAVQTARIATTGGYRLVVDGRIVTDSREAMPPTTVRRGEGFWRLNETTVTGEHVSVRPEPEGMVLVGITTYRGCIRLVPAAGPDFTVVNDVDVESYLAGVLPKELYPAWHPETYRALAVAARTFAMYWAKVSEPAQAYDLGDGQSSQVYGGLTAETSKSWDAVRRTYGQVLACRHEGKEGIFMAQYSACCGGYTNPASAIRNAPDIEPLAGGRECGDCSDCPRFRWPPVRILKADVFKALKAAFAGSPAVGVMDGVDRIDVVSAAVGGRPLWIDVVAPNGRSLRIRAEDLRLSLLRSDVPAAGLYSMNCRMRSVRASSSAPAAGAIEFYDGRGFGHGVGLCQWGAQRKAREGWSAEEILQFYYPGGDIVRLY